MTIKKISIFILIAFILPLLVYIILGFFSTKYLILGLPVLKYGISIIIALCSVIGFTLYILKRKNSRWYFFILITVFSLLMYQSGRKSLAFRRRL